ncbi:TPA: hypothetical protein SMF25_002921 [Serratia marcescens]|nr:hypothetical protein [Serratia marcescens]MBH3111245.1 hypothetical protein [Serratia marcescens]HEJ6963148.1 hypothetical protein [Serratia marcescens]HEJ7952963.1 hypothetical protein [Serratia marcescens]
MTLEEYKKAITSANYEHWTSIGSWGAGSGPSYKDSISSWTSNDRFGGIEIESHSNLLSLKSNLLIQIAHGMMCNKNFKESWANSFADPSASSYFVDFFYANNLVYRDLYVSVDGGRSLLPLPTLEINKETYSVSKLIVPIEKFNLYRLFNHDGYEDYDKYCNDAGFIISETPWMV